MALFSISHLEPVIVSGDQTQCWWKRGTLQNLYSLSRADLVLTLGMASCSLYRLKILSRLQTLPFLYGLLNIFKEPKIGYQKKLVKSQEQD